LPSDVSRRLHRFDQRRARQQRAALRRIAARQAQPPAPLGVGPADGLGAGRALPGGLRDVDIDGWVRAFLARDVFVWAVFDTCSAASMTRSSAAAPANPPDDEVRFRGVRVDLLAQGGSGAPAAAALRRLLRLREPPGHARAAPAAQEPHGRSEGS